MMAFQRTSISPVYRAIIFWTTMWIWNWSSLVVWVKICKFMQQLPSTCVLQKNPTSNPTPNITPRDIFKTSQNVRCRWRAAVLSAATFLKPQPPPYEPYSPNYPQNFYQHWTWSSILWKWSGRDDQAWLKMKRWGETIPNMTRSERRPRTEESIRKALSPTGGHGEALDVPAKTNRNKLKCVSC